MNFVAERVKLSVTAGAAAVIFAASWGIGLDAEVAVSKWPPLRVVSLPTPPRSLYPRALWPNKPGEWALTGTAIDDTGTIVAQVHAAACCEFVIRYNVNSKRWLPGWVNDGLSYPVSASRAGLWVTGAHSGGVWLYRSTFSRTHAGGVAGQIVAYTTKPSWLTFTLPAVDGSGSGWIGGWIYGHVRPKYPWTCPASLPGTNPSSTRACLRGGHAVLALAPPGTSRMSIVKVPAPSPVTLTAVGRDGTVWLLDRCFVKPCPAPRLMRFDPRSHTFRSFVIPRRVWPGGWLPGGPGRDLFVGPDGTVWIEGLVAEGRVWLVSYRNGHFTSRRIAIGCSHGGPASRPASTSCNWYGGSWTGWAFLNGGPFMDSRGDLWYQSGPRIVVADPKTGAVSSISEQARGTLLQDPRGAMWYVLPTPLCRHLVC